MMDLKAYMKKCGVTKRQTVQMWLDRELIPGVVPGETLEDTLFPDNARRPYQNRWLRPGTDADAVRSHILKACLKQYHISHKTCHMSREEFDAMAGELAELGLIRIRQADGIDYYDSTTKSRQYQERSLGELRKFLLELTEAAAKGTTGALLDSMK